MLHCAMASERRAVEYHEGPKAADRFTSVMRRILDVSKDEYKRREATHHAAKKTPRKKPAAK